MNTKNVTLTNVDRRLDSFNTIVFDTLDEAKERFNANYSLLSFINDSMEKICRGWQCTAKVTNKKTGKVTGRDAAIMDESELHTRFNDWLNETHGEGDPMAIAMRLVKNSANALAQAQKALFTKIPLSMLKGMTPEEKNRIPEYVNFADAREANKRAIDNLNELTLAGEIDVDSI